MNLTISFRTALVYSLSLHAALFLGMFMWQRAGTFVPPSGSPGLTRIRVNFELPRHFSPTGDVLPTARVEGAETGTGTGIGEGSGSGNWDIPLYKFNPKPRYPREALRNNIEGTVLLRVQVNERGIAEQVAIEKTSGSELLDKAAQDAVGNWEFIPARQGGIPVASTSRIPIRFQINEESDQ